MFSSIRLSIYFTFFWLIGLEGGSEEIDSFGFVALVNLFISSAMITDFRNSSFDFFSTGAAACFSADSSF